MTVYSGKKVYSSLFARIKGKNKRGERKEAFTGDMNLQAKNGIQLPSSY